MSPFTIFVANAAVFKLVLNAAERCSEVGCQELKVHAIQLGDDPEHADPPFLE